MKGNTTMKFCSKCGTQCEDNAANCTNCGTAFNAPAVTYVNPKDHTAEFDKADIEKNKLFAVLAHVIGLLGIVAATKVNINISNILNIFTDILFGTSVNLTAFLVPLIAIIATGFFAKDSAFATFHNRNAIRLLIAEALLTIIRVIPVLGSIVFTVGTIITIVVRIIACIHVFKGQAKELPIIGGLKFLK